MSFIRALVAMCKSCLQRYTGRARLNNIQTSFNVKKSTTESTEQTVSALTLTEEVKEVLAKKRRSGYVIPSARKREQSKVNNDG